MRGDSRSREPDWASLFLWLQSWRLHAVHRSGDRVRRARLDDARGANRVSASVGSRRRPTSRGGAHAQREISYPATAQCVLSACGEWPSAPGAQREHDGASIEAGPDGEGQRSGETPHGEAASFTQAVRQGLIDLGYDPGCDSCKWDAEEIAEER